MHCERYGSGPRRFLVVHGWSGDHRTFTPLAPFLPAGVTLHALDLPGCGQSPAPGRWSLDAIAGDVASAIRGLAPVTVVGNCTGGLLALRAVQLLKGAGVERFVLLDPFATWPWFIQVFVTPLIGRSMYLGTFANPVGRWVVNAALAGKRNPGTNLTEGFSRASHNAIWRHLKVLQEIRGPEDFRDVSVPMHIVYGARTFAGVRRGMARWRRVWPHATVTEVAGAGHMPIADAPRALAELIFQPVPTRASSAGA
jgi:pimeloyl-ACP methyl ester carboxylesterase